MTIPHAWDGDYSFYDSKDWHETEFHENMAIQFHEKNCCKVSLDNCVLAASTTEQSA
jgi:hypothetical protein